MSYTFICTPDHEWYCKITTLEQLLFLLKTAAIFTLNIQQIHAAVIKNPIYQDVTLKQVEEILNEK